MTSTPFVEPVGQPSDWTRNTVEFVFLGYPHPIERKPGVLGGLCSGRALGEAIKICNDNVGRMRRSSQAGDAVDTLPDDEFAEFAPILQTRTAGWGQVQA